MATKQKLQLEKINLEYSRFVKDQVLTEVQLNEIIDFFEDQHRLTRTCLIGTGIVCGLHLQRTPTQVTLSAGAAITTDGDLLKMELTSYKHFAEYTMPDAGKYDPFYYKEGEKEKVVKLYQLLTDEDKDKITSAQVHGIKDLDSEISNWVAILYLEYYLKDPENCTPINCDNLGQRQVARPRLLVLSKSDLDKVIQRDPDETIGDDIYLKYHEAYESYFTFPVLRPKRVILNQNNTINSITLASAYFKAAKDGSGNITKAIGDLYQAFKFMIDKSESLKIDQLMKRLSENLNKASNPLHAQYTYDFYKDVLVAYNELRDMIYNVAFECCPNIYAFPKHIMLGEPNIEYGSQPPKYRHQFYPSSAVSRNQQNNVIGMFKRLQLMIMNFEPKEMDAIRITPSKDYDRLLEDRAIPFYYGKPADLTKEWNHTQTLKVNEKLNLSYNADKYNPPVPDESLNPLDYSIDEFNFFRIEGHIGKNYKTVLRDLDRIKSSKAVPVDVVAIRLGDARLSDINLDDFECHFEDLNVMLRAFQTEISCLLGEGSNFFSGFSAKPDFPHVNLVRYIPPPDQPPWIIKTDLIKNLIPKRDFAKPGVDLKAAERKEAAEIKTGTQKEGAELKAAKRETFLASGDLFASNVREKIAEMSRLDLKVDFCDRFLKPVFKPERLVKETIDIHPDAFGKFILQALEEPVGTVDELIEKTRNFAASDPDILKLDENNRHVLFEYPVQIIAHLNFAQRFVPGSIREITPKFILDYRNFSLSFCNRLKVMRTRLERFFRTGNYKARGFESNYMNMVDRMERICCSNEKLEVIMREIERRKTEILSYLSFSKYITRHPGLEHKAGTHRGGTFVIVYAGSTSDSRPQRPSREISGTSGLAAVNIAERTKPQYRDVESFALFIVNNDDKIDREEELNNFFEINNIQRSSAYAELVVKELNKRVTDISRIICRDLTQTPEDIVVADFCLPYLCCSECPPVAFIVEKEKEPEPDPDPDPVSLEIEPSAFCSNDRKLYPFIVTPEDGEVATANPDLVNMVKQDEGTSKYHFVPRLAPAAHVGKPIGFTVNGQDVSLTVTVFSNPVAKILVPAVTENQAEITIILKAQPNTETEENFEYKWTFGDGSTKEGQETEARFKKAQFDGEIPVKLTVTNGPCTASDSITVPFQGEEPTLSCQEIVEGFITEKQKFLGLETTKASVSKLNNRTINAIYTAVINVFDGAAALSQRPTAARTLTVIQNVDQLIRQIYELNPPANNPAAARVLEEFIRLLMMLMLNLVRCARNIPEDQVNIILENLAAFNISFRSLISKYPELNNRKIFENSVKDFSQNFVSQDAKLGSALAKFIKAILKFP
jgi:hypothetical protein